MVSGAGFRTPQGVRTMRFFAGLVAWLQGSYRERAAPNFGSRGSGVFDHRTSWLIARAVTLQYR